MTTQPQTSQPKLSQCRKCSEKGFQNIMIYFVQNGVNKTTGRPFWDLKNPNGKAHVHMQKAVTVEVVNERPPPRPAFIGTQAQVTVATTTTNGTATKDQVQERINQSHQENVDCWSAQTEANKDQTLAIREQTKQIGDLVGAIWELVQKQQ